MIHPVERAVQRMMNSLSKPGKPHLDIHFLYYRHPLLPRWMQNIKTPTQTIVMQF